MTAEVPTLTNGLPVDNGERFLAEALDALLAQTYPDFELIICGNSSTAARSALIAPSLPRCVSWGRSARCRSCCTFAGTMPTVLHGLRVAGLAPPPWILCVGTAGNSR